MIDFNNAETQNSCDLIDRVEEFEKLGCRMNGLTKIKSVRNMNGNVMQITALKMEIL